MRWLLVGILYFGLLSPTVAESTTPPRLDPPAYFVLFDANSSAIAPVAQQMLDQVRADYRFYKPAVVHVNGYYDRSLTQQEADHLSKRMAETVRDHLVSMGLPSNAIVLAWHGEDHPIVQTDDGVAESINRSVDILFDGAKNVARP